MRKLASLCRKLRRTGVDVCVISHFRGSYQVYIGSGLSGLTFLKDREFSSVRECEQYLLTLFR